MATGIATLAIIAMSIGAFAYWTSTGSGSGTGSTGTSANNLVVTGLAATALTPGNSSTVSFTVNNPSTFAQSVSGIHLVSVAAYLTSGEAATGGPTGLITGCGGLNTGAVDTSIATSGEPDFWMVDVVVNPATDGHIAASAPAQALTTTGTLNMNDLSHQDQGACKNAFLRLTLTSS